MTTDTSLTKNDPTFQELLQQLAIVVSPERVSAADDVLDGRSHDTWPVATTWAKLGRHPHRPDLVVWAQSEAEVVAVLRLASQAGVPVTPWALGSSVTGQPLPLAGGVVLDVSGLTGDPELDPVDGIVTAPAGVRGSDLEAWLGERGLTLRHSPQSLARSSIGGWVATRATGQFSSRYGGIEELVVGYRVVLADGTTAEVGESPRAAMGPSLKQLFIGSEGTLGVITQVSLKVFELPALEIREAFAFPDVVHALTAMRQGTQRGLRPHVMRLYDADEARHAAPDAPVGQAVLFLGHEGISEVASAEHAAFKDLLVQASGVSLGSAPVDAWMGRRYDFSTVENLLATPGGYAETIEVANSWSRIEPMYRALREALSPLADEVLGHFSHVYHDGVSLYVILLGRAIDDETALERLEQIWIRAMEVVIAHGGEVSHHHGGGLARAPWARQSLGSGFELLERLKDALDPQGLLNPGKLGLAAPASV
ncbi:FAD-binding oxidoreductase [Sphaerimonospora cavernae]|uniref:FAD-binding oxidoreductase n=1 Tax=Sphaerimonospora cavernae TaxID=1740611 RepID=A0ABV6U3C3_9ACTN